MEAERLRAERLAAVDEARTALLRSVGHDLRTPLAGLRLAVDGLRSPDADLDAASRADLLDTVDRATWRLDELITNLLDMGRLEAGALVARPEATAVDAVVASAVLAFPEAAVLVDVSDTLPLVHADPTLLERVVENLVSNAVRYAGPTEQRPVAVSARAEPSAVVVEVADHGPGLNPESDDATARADRGAGLGLAIVRGFCAAMDVAVSFLPTRGGGLTVRLEVPRAEVPA
jgi:two-component system sensor histidine kinase KdpD